METPYDAVIVGGGLAGSATALHLARRGLSVRVLEQKHFPRDKPCGEGVMPHGVRMLEALGVLPLIPQGASRPFLGIEYIYEGEFRARGHFPVLEGGYSEGLGVRRLVLDEALASLARQQAGVVFSEDSKVTEVLMERGRAIGVRTDQETLYGRIVIGADGRGSRVRHALGLNVPVSKRQRYGIRAHLTFADPDRVGDFVEVFRNQFGELYTTPVSTHELLVALLIEKADMDRFGGKLEQGFRDYLGGWKHLRDRFEGSELTSKVLACGPLAVKSREPFAEGALLVGDAAGFLDALTGEGMTLSLKAAEAAAEIAFKALEHGGSASRVALAPYGRARARLIRHYLVMTSVLLWITARPRLSRMLISRLSRTPKLFQNLLGLNCGHFRLGEVAWGEALRFLVGI